jgi:hypothetical protein
MRFGTRFQYEKPRRTRLGLVAFSVLLAIGVVAATDWFSNNSATALGGVTRRLVSPSVANNDLIPPTDRPAVAAPVKTSVSAALQREFMDAPDLYAFAQRARRRPAEGGLFYAEQAQDYCRVARPEGDQLVQEGSRNEIEGTATVSARRAEVAERYRSRCAGFRDTDRGSFYRALNEESKNRSDPLLTAMADLRAARKSGDVDATLQRIKALVDLHDPLLLSTYHAYLVSPDRVADASPRGLWFEGRDYRASTEEGGIYSVSLSLATCVPNAPCRDDFYVYLRCVSSGFCADDPDDMLFNDPEVRRSVPAERIAQIHTLVDRMRAAIERGDIDAFRAPR